MPHPRIKFLEAIKAHLTKDYDAQYEKHVIGEHPVIVDASTSRPRLGDLPPGTHVLVQVGDFARCAPIVVDEHIHEATVYIEITVAAVSETARESAVHDIGEAVFHLMQSPDLAKALAEVGSFKKRTLVLERDSYSSRVRRDSQSVLSALEMEYSLLLAH